MKNIRIILMIAAIVTFVFVGGGCQNKVKKLEVDSNQETKTESSDKAEQAEDNQKESTATDKQQETDPSEKDKQYYVDLDLVDIEGNPVKLSDYEGKFIALNFFGTWCKFCMQEMPDLEKVYSEYEGDDLVILLVNVTTTEKEGKEAVAKWYQNGGYTMPMVLDLDGAAMQTYSVQSFPTTYFIAKDGEVLGAVQGALDQNTLESIIQEYNK